MISFYEFAAFLTAVEIVGVAAALSYNQGEWPDSPPYVVHEIDSKPLTFRSTAGIVARKVVSLMPERLSSAIKDTKKYYYKYGRLPNLIRPKTFNEKLQWRKIFDNRPIFSTWADKVKVRTYVQALGLGAILPEVYWMGKNPDQIPFDLLPDKYVVKASHGSGWVEIVTNGNAVSHERLKETCREWLSKNYFEENHELIYKDVEPQIIIEQFLDNEAGAPAEDYKFYVFGGRVQFIQVDIDRFGDHRRAIMDADWNQLDVQLTVQKYEGEKLRAPKLLGLMILAAEHLSTDIDFVRVDLYESRGIVYFGEMTPSSGNGFNTFTPASWDGEFGGHWKNLGD